MGGGIVSNKLSLNFLKKENKKLPLKENFSQKYDEYRHKYYSLDKNSPKYYENLKNLLLEHTFFFKSKENPLIFKRLKELDKICKNRKKNLKIYESILKHKLITKPILSKDCIPWRYTFRLLNNREFILEELRKANIDCSSWYIPNHLIFSRQNLKNAELLNKEIVNLWLNISTKKIRQNCFFMLQLLNSLNC
ncbi:hypothetical protein FMM56_00075 [Campylobacter sp. LR264d]|uniref:hypothetical protein n=1 Tax=Campylobacter sp. LR264d TaxID=2593544 RepID=UPI0012397092|nr:hypothetical protein [Campylobacter sp. LR264d]KAA6234448.1 hypothetical protein FMM56_00075 [Campylobacter sp. LR264d]